MPRRSLKSSRKRSGAGRTSTTCPTTPSCTSNPGKAGRGGQDGASDPPPLPGSEPQRKARRSASGGRNRPDPAEHRRGLDCRRQRQAPRARPSSAGGSAAGGREVEQTGDERYVLGIVLEPEVVDAQDDIYSAAEIREAAHRFMEEYRNIGLMHRGLVNGRVKILESYLAPTPFALEGAQVRKGPGSSPCGCSTMTCGRRSRAGSSRG